MDNLPGSPILWGAIIALVIIAFVFRRLQRKRRPFAPPLPDTAGQAGMVENLDSSHIGGPIFPTASDRETRADQKPSRNGEPAGARK